MRMRAKYVTLVRPSKGIAERWRTQYERPNGNWPVTAHGSSMDIHEALCALGEDPDPDDVAKIIGNKSWSYHSCSGCGDYYHRLVEIGEYEQKSYCKTCLTEALALLEDTDCAQDAR